VACLQDCSVERHAVSHTPTPRRAIYHATAFRMGRYGGFAMPFSTDLPTSKTATKEQFIRAPFWTLASSVHCPPAPPPPHRHPHAPPPPAPIPPVQPTATYSLPHRSANGPLPRGGRRAGFTRTFGKQDYVAASLHRYLRCHMPELPNAMRRLLHYHSRRLWLNILAFYRLVVLNALTFCHLRCILLTTFTHLRRRRSHNALLVAYPCPKHVEQVWLQTTRLRQTTTHTRMAAPSLPFRFFALNATHRCLTLRIAFCWDGDLRRSRHGSPLPHSVIPLRAYSIIRVPDGIRVRAATHRRSLHCLLPPAATPAHAGSCAPAYLSHFPIDPATSLRQSRDF